MHNHLNSLCLLSHCLVAAAGHRSKTLPDKEKSTHAKDKRLHANQHRSPANLSTHNSMAEPSN